MAKRPGGAMLQNTVPTKSQLIPLMTKWQYLGQRSQLWPVLVTILFFFLLNFFGSETAIVIPIKSELHPGHYLDPRGWIYTSQFLIVLALYLSLVSLYFLYRIVGKQKSWVAMVGVFAFTGYFLWLFRTEHDFGWMYEFFHGRLAGGDPDDSMPFLQLFISHFLGTGFFEETVKGLPLLILMFAGTYMGPQMAAKFGIEEPLDGILLGAASGGGFALLETLTQYVPGVLVKHWIAFELLVFNKVDSQHLKALMDALNSQQAMQLINGGSDLLGTSPGTSDLIVRSLDLGFGHMAYTGYFGYFIGLAVLKPEQRWKILGIGLVSASIPHALWDTILSVDSTPLTAIVAVFSYAVLAAAVLKAREISPNRAMLQPSMVFGPANPAPVAPPPASSGAAAAQAQAYVPMGALYAGGTGAAVGESTAVVQNTPPPGTTNLRIGTKILVIVPGLRLLAHQVPGLQSSSPEGLVAEITRNPADPNVLGLTNLSTTPWEVVTANSRRDIQPGQTIKLAPGTKIDFGSTDGEVN